MPSEFENKCETWLKSQFGSLEAHPEVAKATFGAANFLDAGREIARSIEAGGFSTSNVEAIAKQFGMQFFHVIALVNSLCAGETPLVEMVLRDKNGNRLPEDTFQRGLLSAWIARRSFVYWEAVRHGNLPVLQ